MRLTPRESIELQFDRLLESAPGQSSAIGSLRRVVRKELDRLTGKMSEGRVGSAILGTREDFGHPDVTRNVEP